MIDIGVMLTTTAFVLASAIVDSEHILKKEHIKDHKSRWYLRWSFCFVIAIYNPLNGIASGLLFYTLFDQTLNFFRGLPFWYLGTVAKHDIFFNKRKYLYILTKLICLVLSIILFIL